MEKADESLWAELEWSSRVAAEFSDHNDPRD
jgi:hypothetical protein